MRPGQAPRQLMVVILVLSLGLAACGQSGRPTVEEWLPAWEHALRSIPDQEELTTDSARELCDDALVDLRIHHSDLVPTPDEAIDDTVDGWVDTAEHAFFECPPIEGFDATYAKLERLEAEVEVVLEIDTGP